MEDEDETVLLSLSFPEIRDGAGMVTSGTSGRSGISKDTADKKQNSKVKKKKENVRVLPQIDSISFKE